MKEKVLMLLACLWLGIGFSMAQAPKTVAGVVTSADDGEPIIGASVLVEGTTMGAITDVDGKFAINNVPADAKALIVSYLGMITQRVGIQRGTITVTMKSDTKVLDEVVVTAQGLNRKQKALGYSTQKVAGEDLTISRQTDLGNAMAGKVSGARFIGGASSGFDAGTIILRGAGSIPSSSQSDNPANEPIYVVDGAITNKNSINMDDVEIIHCRPKLTIIISICRSCMVAEDMEVRKKVTGLRIFMICIVVIFPVCKVLMCTIIMRTLLGELHTIRL